MSKPKKPAAPAAPAVSDPSGGPPARDEGQRIVNALLMAAVLALVFLAAGVLLKPAGVPEIAAPAPTPMAYVPYASTPGD